MRERMNRSWYSVDFWILNPGSTQVGGTGRPVTGYTLPTNYRRLKTDDFCLDADPRPLERIA
jgi:hypothetical protein